MLHASDVIEAFQAFFFGASIVANTALWLSVNEAVGFKHNELRHTFTQRFFEMFPRLPRGHRDCSSPHRRLPDIAPRFPIHARAAVGHMTGRQILQKTDRLIPHFAAVACSQRRTSVFGFGQERQHHGRVSRWPQIILKVPRPADEQLAAPIVNRFHAGRNNPAPLSKRQMIRIHQFTLLLVSHEFFDRGRA